MSVGIDIDRLGLMLVNGQPKLAAEYIQATSRVGRGEVQGLVVTVLSAMKSRDRSHYEDFKAFHENLYRFVEPTSVTPLAPPALGRTLHASLVAVIRNTTVWGGNQAAPLVDLDSDEMRDLVVSLANRVAAAEPHSVQRVQSELREVVDYWRDHQQHNLLYHRGVAGAQFETLLSSYGGADQSGLKTMQTMRHVDSEVTVRIVQPGANR
jgi:hypothetical protein